MGQANHRLLARDEPPIWRERRQRRRHGRPRYWRWWRRWKLPGWRWWRLPGWWWHGFPRWRRHGWPRLGWWRQTRGRRSDARVVHGHGALGERQARSSGLEDASAGGPCRRVCHQRERRSHSVLQPAALRRPRQRHRGIEGFERLGSGTYRSEEG